jgi:hypothetical protein
MGGQDAAVEELGNAEAKGVLPEALEPVAKCRAECPAM